MAVRVIPLGGLGEVGMNAMVLEEDGRRILIDCGVLFPDDQVLGVEVAIPDLRYIRESGGLDAVVLTHGHEDHVGALSSVLQEFPVPVYGTGFTLALVKERLEEHGLDTSLLHEVTPRTSFRAGPFLTEPIRVTHSIPDGCGFAFETGEGVVVHTGDFKIDLTPVGGERLDLARFADYGSDGVSLLLSDSTNSELEGFSLSEAEVAEGLSRRVRSCTGRVVVALFASNVHRIQSLLAIAAATGRKVVLAGRSLTRNVRIASDLGILRVPDAVLIDEESAASTPPNKLLLLTSGAQGEPNSALARIAMGAHRHLRVEPGDEVIFSSRSIPGNELAISQLANQLARQGATVIDRSLETIHVSGHAQVEEQKIMLDAVQPRTFVPIHGEYRMMLAHARTALSMGMNASDVFVIEDGDVIELSGGAARQKEPVASGRVWLDTRGGRDVNEVVLRERGLLSENGVVIALVVVDRKTGDVVRGPELTGQGVSHFHEGSDRHALAVMKAREAVDDLPPNQRTLAGNLEEALSTALRRALRTQYGKRPAILPIAVLM